MKGPYRVGPFFYVRKKIFTFFYKNVTTINIYRIFVKQNNTKTMKTTAKNIKKGMTIQYTGYHTTENGISYVSCGSIKKTSPIVTIVSVEDAQQMFAGLRGLFAKTECGLTLKFSTRQSILIL